MSCFSVLEIFVKFLSGLVHSVLSFNFQWEMDKVFAEEFRFGEVLFLIITTKGYAQFPMDVIVLFSKLCL